MKMKINLFKTIIGASFLIVAFSIAYFLVFALPSKQSSTVKSAQFSQSLTEKPTSTPQPTATPTIVPTKAPVAQQTTTPSVLNCNKITGDLMDKYQNLYTVDDILIKDYKECHYKLLRDNGHEVNDNNIRSQIQPNNLRGNEYSDLESKIDEQERKTQQLGQEMQQQQWDLERKQRAEAFDCIENGGVYSRSTGTCR